MNLALWLELREMALSHHQPHQYERCVVISGRHVCRRCAVLYPIAFVVMGLAMAGLDAPLWLILALPIPMTVEVVVENFAGLRYSGRRQAIATAIAGPALGLAFARVVVDRADPWFWGAVVIHGIPFAIAVLATARRELRREADVRDAADDAHPFVAGFGSADAFRAYLDDSAKRLGI